MGDLEDERLGGLVSVTLTYGDGCHIKLTLSVVSSCEANIISRANESLRHVSCILFVSSHDYLTLIKSLTNASS
jgi:hypothetical protein